MDFQTWANPSQLSLGGLVALMIVSILKGWVVPRSVHRDRVNDKDAQILALAKERDDWKAAYQKSAEARHELLQQNSDLIDGADTTNHLLDSLRDQIERNGPRYRTEGRTSQ